MSIFDSREFKRLKDEWRKKLEESGFEDIEDSSGRLKSPDQRTIAFQNQDRIRSFFLDLDSLLVHYPEMPHFERKVLEMYSEGVSGTIIAREVKASRRTVVAVIARYKGLLKALNRIRDSETDCALSTHMSVKSYDAHEGVDDDRTDSDKAA